LLLGGWYWGYLLAAVAFQFVFPLFTGDVAWRAMFWIAIIPGLLTLWATSKVPESPLWLERQRQLLANPRAAADAPKLSLLRIFQGDLLATTLQTTAVIGAFMCSFYSIGTWYATLLRRGQRPTLPYLVAFNIGAICGTAIWGRISEGRLGRRGAVTITALLGIASIPLYLYATSPELLFVGAFMMGAFGCGIWGMAPAYVTERYPTEARGIGPGFCYHAAAAIGALMPLLIGWMDDRGVPLETAMAIPIAIALTCSAAFIWLGPETRGRQLSAGTD
jgi:MFS family permease